MHHSQNCARWCLFFCGSENVSCVLLYLEVISKFNIRSDFRTILIIAYTWVDDVNLKKKKIFDVVLWILELDILLKTTIKIWFCHGFSFQETTTMGLSPTREKTWFWITIARTVRNERTSVTFSLRWWTHIKLIWWLWRYNPALLYHLPPPIKSYIYQMWCVYTLCDRSKMG